MNAITQLDPVALRTLATAVRVGTFEAAAKELHVTPSAVSQRIKALETRVGRVLVHRTKPLEATDAGHVLVRLAAQTEVLEREAYAELVVDDPDGLDGVEAPWTAIPLAVNSDAMFDWFVEALVGVRERHRVTFEILREDQSRTTERLRRGEVMAAITSDPRPVPGCKVERLGAMRYLAVANQAYVAEHLPDGPTPAALERAPMVAFDRDDTLQHDFLRKVTRRHLAPPTTLIPSVHQFDHAVHRGLGWGMLIDSEVREDLETGKLVEIVPGRHVDVPLFWQRWRLESPVMVDLTAAVTAQARVWLEG